VTPSQVNAPLSLTRVREKNGIFHEKSLVATSQVNAPLSLNKRKKVWNLFSLSKLMS